MSEAEMDALEAWAGLHYHGEAGKLIHQNEEAGAIAGSRALASAPTAPEPPPVPPAEAAAMLRALLS